MKTVFYSNKGAVRDHNEDAVFANGSALCDGSMASPCELETDKSCGCLAVIDGMGGHAGGGTAARLAASAFLSGADLAEVPFDEAEDEINGIVEEASMLMQNAAAEDGSLASMGAALAGIAVCGDGVLVFNCGDCRVYRFQGGYLEKLSHDHSIVQELFDSGEIDEDAMRTHPRKNVVTSAVMADNSLKSTDVFFRKLPRASAERFFICSDGVWEALQLDDIESYLSDDDMKRSSAVLAEALLRAGCSDNVSFILADISSGA